MVAAARKYNRIVQCPNGSRTQNGGREALDYVAQGNLGKIVTIRGLRFGPRSSIGKVGGPQPIPATVDYGLWSGPAPIVPLARQNLHYDWHWNWLYGNGELGNWGIHLLDGCRMAAGGGLPRHAISIAGRFGYQDDGQTPNTQIVYFDYQPAPVLFELRGLPKNKSFLTSTTPDFWGKDAMDTYLGISIGKVIHCEHGYVVGSTTSHAAFDLGGKRIREFKPTTPELGHNFIQAVRSRRAGDLAADILDGADEGLPLVHHRHRAVTASAEPALLVAHQYTPFAKSRSVESDESLLAVARGNRIVAERPSWDILGSLTGPFYGPW